VDWKSLRHACGPALTTAAELEALASDDAEERSRAFGELTSSIIHQGSVYSATAAAVPFLAQIAEMQKADSVVMLGWIAEGNANLRRHYPEDLSEPWVQDLERNLRAAGTRILELGRSADRAETRTWAVWFIRMLPPSADDLDALRACLETERDAVVRATIALGLPPDDPLQRQLIGGDEDPLVRLCAAAQVIPVSKEVGRLVAIAATSVPESGRFAELPDRSHEDTSPVRLIASRLGAVSVDQQVEWTERWLAEPAFTQEALYAAADAAATRRSAARLLLEPVTSLLVDTPFSKLKSTAAFALVELGLPGVDRLQDIKRSAEGELREVLDRYLHGSETEIEWFRYKPPSAIAELRDYVQRDIRPAGVSTLQDDLRVRACAEAIARIEGRELGS